MCTLCDDLKSHFPNLCLLTCKTIRRYRGQDLKNNIGGVLNEHLPLYNALHSANLSHTQDLIKQIEQIVVLFVLILRSSISIFLTPLYSSVFSHPFALVKASFFSFLSLPLFFDFVLFSPSDPSSPLANLTACHRLTLLWCLFHGLHDREGLYMAHGADLMKCIDRVCKPVYQTASMTD